MSYRFANRPISPTKTAVFDDTELYMISEEYRRAEREEINQMAMRVVAVSTWALVMVCFFKILTVNWA